MEITTRGLWTLIHGMGFGALYLLACSGALLELHRFTTSHTSPDSTPGHERFLKGYLITMVVLAWAAVLTGAYVIYPWYRAAPPPGAIDLSMYPQRLLMSSPTTIGWHSLGMEWKEHVAWLAHLDHHGRVRLHPLRPRPQESQATSRRGALLCPGFVSCRGHRRFLRRDDR